MKGILLMVGLGWVGAGHVQGCGISWNKPSFHFDSVNEWGYVSYWEEIGTVDMGGREVPLFIHFLSNKKTSSPYLGYGWTLALLESRVEQVDENKFRIWQPNGKYRTFRRDEENPNLLKGSGGWLGEISGDRIIAKADCGWGLTFKNGKITSMSTPDGKTYGYRYESGKVKSIEEVQSGEEVFEVVKDPLEPKLIQLKMGDSTIVLEQGEKPRIERINGQNLIGGMDTSLTRIVKADGRERALSYEVEPSSIVPTFKPDVDRTITWQPSTGIVSQDRDWKYEIKQDSNDSWNNAAITQINKNKEKEFWYHDKNTGVETILNKNGVKTINQWFVSGKLRGKRRSAQKVYPSGKKELVESYVYDSQANVKRFTKDGESWTLEYDDKDRLLSFSKNRREPIKVAEFF